jgi:alkylation response protein AidB-like acyl-CoA dehydrogenase
VALDFALGPELKRLQDEARRVAVEGARQFGRLNDSWINGYSKGFSRILAEHGWIGMTWPTEFGGAGRPGIERVIVAEQLIGAGAPIAASWIADRQMGPAIYRYGTADQRAKFLPGMLSGEETWCIGMSEPNAGSDLASLRTSARRVGDRFIVNGQKIWTSLAADADYCYLIVRTDSSGPPHKGVSELIVPMTTPGIEVRPITDLVGNRHFCEVWFTDAEVPAENLVGTEGDAFRQTMAQLEHERGGIDRLMSNRPLYEDALKVADLDDHLIRDSIARLEIGYRLGRHMVYQAALGQAPSGASTIIKCYCTEHEQRVADFCSRVFGAHGVTEPDLARAIAYAPAYTIQGGTSNVMRNILGERVLGLPREPMR